MSTGKLCGIAIIIVVICPIVLGMVWPTGTEEVDTWHAEPAMDLTDGLSTRDIKVYETYTGPLNNLTVYNSNVDALVFPAPRGTTDVPNAYPLSARESTVSVTSVTIADIIGSEKARYGMGSLTGMTVTGQTGTFSYADYWPQTNVLTLYNANMDPTTLTPGAEVVISASDLTLITFGAPTAWIDISQGLTRTANPWTWLNGMDNRSVEVWVSFVAVNHNNQIMIDTITMTRAADGMITVTDGTVTEQLGTAYTFVKVNLNDTGTASVTGLIGVDDFNDGSYTEGNVVEGLTCSTSLGYVTMKGSYMSWLVKSTVSAIASTTGIEDASFTPDSYWPSHAWQVTLVNPSTFGDSISIGAMAYPVDSGAIEVTNVETGETSTVQVRGMKILSLVLDGQQKIFVNGILAQTLTPQAVSIGLDGEWYMSVVLAKVTQETHEKFIWDVGAFGFDQQNFCIVGLLSCVAVAIAGSVWGRTSGESVLALHITMILCGIAFLVML